jgi:hypothetical protein
MPRYAMLQGEFVFVFEFALAILAAIRAISPVAATRLSKSLPFDSMLLSCIGTDLFRR